MRPAGATIRHRSTCASSRSPRVTSLYTHLPPEDYYYRDFLQRTYNRKAKELPNKLAIRTAALSPSKSPSSTLSYTYGEVIIQMLNEAGFKAKLQVIEWSKWLSDVYGAREYQATLIGHVGEADPYLLLDRFTKRRIGII